VIQFLIFIAIGDDLVVHAKHRGNEALLLWRPKLSKKNVVVVTDVVVMLAIKRSTGHWAILLKRMIGKLKSSNTPRQRRSVSSCSPMCVEPSVWLAGKSSNDPFLNFPLLNNYDLVPNAFKHPRFADDDRECEPPIYLAYRLEIHLNALKHPEHKWRSMLEDLFVSLSGSVIVSSSTKASKRIRDCLQKSFRVQDLGKLEWFLGGRVSWDYYNWRINGWWKDSISVLNVQSSLTSVMNCGAQSVPSPKFAERFKFPSRPSDGGCSVDLTLHVRSPFGAATCILIDQNNSRQLKGFWGNSCAPKTTFSGMSYSRNYSRLGCFRVCWWYFHSSQHF
jgi:hypothetical protein